MVGFIDPPCRLHTGWRCAQSAFPYWLQLTWYREVHRWESWRAQNAGLTGMAGVYGRTGVLVMQAGRAHNTSKKHWLHWGVYLPGRLKYPSSSGKLSLQEHRGSNMYEYMEVHRGPRECRYTGIQLRYRKSLGQEGYLLLLHGEYAACPHIQGRWKPLKGLRCRV